MTSLKWVVGFDLETTGIDVFTDRIVTASIVYVNQLGQVIQTYEWLVNPGIEIPEGAAAVHGISTEHAREHGDQPVTALYEIAGVLSYFLSNDVPVVAYNAAYDFSLLDCEIQRHLGYSGFGEFFDNGEIPPLIIDPLVIDKRLDRYRKGRRTLTATAQLLGVELENAHTSADDSLAAALITQALWDKYPVLNEGPLEELFEAQKNWYSEQQLGLQNHFKRQGKEENVNTVWPIQKLT